MGAAAGGDSMPHTAGMLGTRVIMVQVLLAAVRVRDTVQTVGMLWMIGVCGVACVLEHGAVKPHATSMVRRVCVRRLVVGPASTVQLACWALHSWHAMEQVSAGMLGGGRVWNEGLDQGLWRDTQPSWSVVCACAGLLPGQRA